MDEGAGCTRAVVELEMSGGQHNMQCSNTNMREKGKVDTLCGTAKGEGGKPHSVILRGQGGHQ